jgi:hypothetical protein
MVRKVLDFSVPTAVEADGTIAAWAAEAANPELALPGGEDTLTRADGAMLLYQISRVRSAAPGLSAIFRK